ncbi:MAG: sigma-70 family RNA polymerase sigma factor [Verrucomicrobiae bacterium]|nr:sigma-70 family RNA polymerase sigma factor [Verrucomicrobiae bacterium]
MTARQQLERIYDTYAEVLFQYFRARTRSCEQARDLLQDLFVRLGAGSAAAALGDGVQNEKAWLFTIARNLVIDHARSADARQRKVHALENEMSATGFFAPSPDPDLARLREDLSAALLALPEPQRIVVYLRLIAGLTFEEIATAEEIPSNTAVSRYRYGIDKLQAALGPVYSEFSIDP